jgi:hypothetical protein
LLNKAAGPEVPTEKARHVKSQPAHTKQGFPTVDQKVYKYLHMVGPHCGVCVSLCLLLSEKLVCSPRKHNFTNVDSFCRLMDLNAKEDRNIFCC